MLANALKLRYLCIILCSTMTADNAAECAACVIKDILSCYELLTKLPSLEPSPSVDSLFSKLVELCSQTLDEATSAAVGPSTYLESLPMTGNLTLGRF